MKRFLGIGVSVLLLLGQIWAAPGAKRSPKADLKNVPKTNQAGTLQVDWTPQRVQDDGLRDIDLAYHDGTFESQIGCGGSCAFAVRFTADMPMFLTGLTLYFQGDASETAGYISIYADPDAGVAGPPSQPAGPNDGTAIWESGPVDLSSPDGSLISVSLPIENLPIDGGDFYVVVWEQTNFLGIANDLQMNYLDRNWVYTGSWTTINDAVGGDPTLTGNFGITVTYIPQNITGSYMVVSPTNIDFGVIQIADGAVSADVTISNFGDTAFDITDIVIDNPDFSTSLSLPATVPADSFITMDVVLTPATTGLVEATFTIVSTADNIDTALVHAAAMVYDGFPQYLVWNPAASPSAAEIVSTLEGMGYTAFETTDLFFFGDPVQVGYDAVFVCLGIYPDNYVLSEDQPEVAALVSFAQSGGALYMEGGDTWAFDSPTSLHSYFGIDGISDGSGDLDEVVGVGFAAGMDYPYAGGNSWIDHLAPLGPEPFVIHLNPADSAACGIAWNSPTTHTIGTSFEFGGLVDTTYTKADLMAAYLEFFTQPYTDNVPPQISGVTSFEYTLDTTGPYVIQAVVTDNTQLSSVSLYYSLNGGAFTEVAMIDSGNGLYSGEIPGQPVGTTVGFYVSATDTAGNTAVEPADAPNELYVFSVLSHLPPTYVTAESGLDGHVVLNWMPPGTEQPPIIECADFQITQLPYSDFGSNAGMGDDFDVTFSDGEDVAYQIDVVGNPVTLTITLCNGTDYDSKLEVFYDDCQTSTGYYNDDFCGLQSELDNVYLEPGTYLIVIDGFGGATGNYYLDVYEQTERVAPHDYFAGALQHEVSKIQSNGLELASQTLSSPARRYYRPANFRELLGFGIYRNTASPVLIDPAYQVVTLDSTVLTYDDTGLSNGTTYYYRVSAIYSDGEAASGEVAATPVNYPPAAPQNLVGTADGLVAILDWDDNTDYDLAYYNVYRDEVLIDTTTVSAYYDSLSIGGLHLYQVTAVDADGAESDLSNRVQLVVGNDPPMNLRAESGLDGQVALQWDPPGTEGPPQLDCADYVITGLPFTDVGSNAGMNDDFDVMGSDGEDVAYQLYLPTDATIDVTLCSDNTDYDTKLEIFNADCFTSTGYYDDDDFDCSVNILQSGIWGAYLPAGTYLIVVDGFGGSTGNYEINVTESVVARRPIADRNDAMAYEMRKLARAHITPTRHDLASAPLRLARPMEYSGFLVYRDGVVVSDTLDPDTLNYVDQYLPNGVEYCYVVQALYPDVNSNSNEACATPENHPPAPPQNLEGVVNDHDITLTWSPNTDYDLASYNVYRNDTLITNLTDTTYSEHLPVSGIYVYNVTAVDAEGAESAYSNTVILPVGNLPPSAARAVSGLDGAVDLYWMEPGIIGGAGLSEGFESGIFPPEGWTQIINDANASWQLYDSTNNAEMVHSGLYSGGVWWDFDHQDEWLITPAFTVGATDQLTFWSYAYQGSQYGDHYYVKVSADGGQTWDVALDMSALPVYDNPDANNFNTWITPYTVDLSAYAGQTIQLAFHAIDVNDPNDPNYPGLWYIWMIDDIEVGPPGAAPRFVAHTGLRGLEIPNAARATAAVDWSFQHRQLHGNRLRSIRWATPMVVHTVRPELRSQLMGYSIYRSDTSPVALDDAHLIADLDTLTFSYHDFPLINGQTYYYIITANYTDEISATGELSATPQNHPPAVPTGLTGVGDEQLNVTLDWDDNTDYDFGYYRVYRNDVYIADANTSEFSETLDSSGIYTYYVTAVDTGGLESEPSEAVAVLAGMLPPGRVRAVSGLDGQVDLTWTPPGVTGPEPLPCADFIIEELPFSDVNSNAGMGDDFDVTGSDGEDVAYQIYIYEGDVIDITFCSANTDYDTKVEIFNADCMTSTGYYNDDGSPCPESPAFYPPSELLGVSLPEGNYLIVVDGFGGGVGNYEIQVNYSTTNRHVTPNRDLRAEFNKWLHRGIDPTTVEMTAAPVRLRENRVLTGYQVYRDGQAVSEVLPPDSLHYLDGYIPNGVEYCYTVAAIYTSGQAMSEPACATPENHPPAIPVNLVGGVDSTSNTVMLDWDDNTDWDLAGYNVYRNDTLVATVDTSEYSEVVPDNSYRYYVTAVDDGGLESGHSNSVTIIVGEAPPENLRADGEFDDHIHLSWFAPGGGGTQTEFRYDDGVVTGQLGFTSPGDNTVFGAAHFVNATLTSVQWYLTSEGGPHDQVTILILGLDANGIPDGSQVLHMSSPQSNVDDQWNEYTLPEPVDAPNGFFVGVMTPNQFTALATDDGIDPPWEFQWGTQWANVDYTSAADWLDIGNAGFMVNFLIRAYGQAYDVVERDYSPAMTRRSKEAYLALNYGEHPAVITTPLEHETAPSLREVVSYNIYRDGSLVGNTADTQYDDLVDEGINYTYFVTAVYSNGQESGPSNAVTVQANMPPGAPTSFMANPIGHSVELSWEDPTVNADGSECVDLEGLRLYRDGQLIATIDPLEWYYLDTGVADGPHHYELQAFDEVPNYGEFAMVDVWVGPPPTIFDFEDGVIPDGWTQSNPGQVPWQVGTPEDLSSTFWTIPNNGTGLICAINDDAAGSGADGNNSLITRAFDFTHSPNVHLVFDSYYDGAYSAMAYVEYRLGANGNWVQLLQLAPDMDWTTIDIDLSSLAGQPEVYLAFHHDDQGAWGSGWAIDNVNLEGLVTALMGDLDGDGELHINDLTRMIEIILEMGDPPSADELGVIDMNNDGAYNVLDAVILLEAILNNTPLSKPVPAKGQAAVEIPATTLSTARDWQDIPVHITYDGPVAGLQVTIQYDTTAIQLGTPELGPGNENVTVFSSQSNGELRALAVDLSGGTIQIDNGLLMNIPVQVLDGTGSGPVQFEVVELILSGPGGTPIETDFVVSTVSIEALPTEYALERNFPNPFNPTTLIKYQLPEATQVELAVYNLLGQKIRTLVSGNQAAGYYTVQWNGRNDAGQPVPTGIYLYVLRAGNFVKSHKMALIK